MKNSKHKNSKTIIRAFQLAVIFLSLLFFVFLVRFLTNLYGFVIETGSTITWKAYVPYSIASLAALFAIIFEACFFGHNKLRNLFFQIVRTLATFAVITFLLGIIFLVITNWEIFLSMVWFKTISIPGCFVKGFLSALAILLVSVGIFSLITCIKRSKSRKEKKQKQS